MPLAAIHPRQGITTIANVYLALLILPNDLHGGVDNIRVVFNDFDQIFHQFISFETIVHSKDNNREEKFHDFLIKKMESGSFKKHALSGFKCSNNGMLILPEMDQWNPKFFKLGSKIRDITPLTMDDVFVPKIEHVEINVPSGELLVADWFRLEQFNTIINELKDENDRIDLNSAKGISDKTKLMASINMAHVYVGNTCPSVKKTADDLIIVCATNYYDDDIEQMSDNMDIDHSWNICTDLWWASLIDKQTLIDLLSQRMTLEEATKEVNDYLNKNKDTPIINVKPGTYHLYFTDHYEKFSSRFESQELDISSLGSPYLLFSPKPIPLNSDVYCHARQKAKPMN